MTRNRWMWMIAVASFCALVATASFGATVSPTAVFEGPVRPTYTDVGEALLNGRGEFYGWYRGMLADQPIRDAMQQFVTGVVLPDLSYVLEADCPQVIAKMYKGEGGQMDMIYRRLGNLYENLSSTWSVITQGRNYSIDFNMLTALQGCLVNKPVKPHITQQHRDALALKVVSGKYQRQGLDWSAVYPNKPPLKSQIGNIGAVNVRQSFPPAGDLQLLVNADKAHGAASGIGIFPLSVDETARAYEDGPGCKSLAKHEDRRSCLHFRQMKRFRGFCDPRWGADGCNRWKHVQHKHFALWTEAQKKGDWRASRNADSDHQLAHICTNYRNPELDVRFSVPGVDEHEWPVMNCEQALVAAAP